MTDWEFKPSELHRVYLDTATKHYIAVSERARGPFEDLSDEVKMFDIALAEYCNGRIKEWLDKAPRVYGHINEDFGHIFMDEHKALNTTHTARLVDIQQMGRKWK